MSAMAFRRDFKDGKWPFGGQGVPDDVPSPTRAACLKISEILASADEHAGEYSFGGLAKTLPVVPGLFVNDVGSIPLPLTPEHAEKLIAKCAKSLFGHNMDTKMDESVRKSWQLEPDQVELRNPLWQIGLEKLTETIATRLGYKDVPLNCVLYKLLVYGEGGHFLKHQDTEKEDGKIATLVVQPPSTHEGGDLIVYRNGQVEHRHDFGKADATAAYFPHYALHYSDAEHALEDVTKGYRLALVYSICLPESKYHLKRDQNMTMSDELAKVIKGMGPEDDSFALLLSNEYTKKSIGELGADALKGVDGARVRVLKEANTLVPYDKQLRFFIAKLDVKVETKLSEDGWWLYNGEQGLHWYSSSGEDLEHWGDTLKSKKLNFLNPGLETFFQLWQSYGNSEDVYTGNEGTITRTKYARFAVIAWPANRHVEIAAALVSAEFAVEQLMPHRPVGVAQLRGLLDAASTAYSWGVEPTCGDPSYASVRFCRSFCELLVEANDLELTKLFLTNCCPRLGYLADNTTLIPVMTKIARLFSWDDISDELLTVIGNRTKSYSYRTCGVSTAEVLLLVASGLDDGIATQALIDAAIAEKDYILRSREAVEVMCNAVRSGDKQIFDLVTSETQKVKPQELGHYVEVFTRYITDYDEASQEYAVLKAIAVKRVEWLKEEIERLDKLDKTFSWRMPFAESDLEDFFQGPEQSLTVRGILTFGDAIQEFANLSDAKEYAAMILEDEEQLCSFTTEVGEDKGIFVTFTKTKTWFEDSQTNLARFQSELAHLSQIY